MAEINAILSLGVELKCNQRLGRDFTIAELRAQGYKAIFLGVGLPKGRKLDLPGSDLAGVYDGMDFLRAFNEGNPLPVGKRIIVIGGGNVAYDVARSAVRPLEPLRSTTPMADMERGESVAYDVARSAMRLSGDKEVHVVCLEKRSEMPADEIEVTEGAEEGRSCITRAGRGNSRRRMAGCRAAHRGVRIGFDANRRFNPTFNESNIGDIAADTIIFSIGQSSDLSFLRPKMASSRSRTDQGRSGNLPDDSARVFACGDIAHGPRLFIHAIRSAQIAARSMHDYLRGTHTVETVQSSWEQAAYTMRENWDRCFARDHPPVPCSGARRFAHRDRGHYPPEAARAQAARCLRCNVNTVFETSICVACTGCVDVCPEDLIRLAGWTKCAAHKRDATG